MPPSPLTVGNVPTTDADAIDPLAEAQTLLGACAWPSEAYWRVLELAAVRRQLAGIADPVLELGCGDGAFTELAGLSVELAVDREQRAVERAARRSSVYRAVRRADIRELDVRWGPFGTIFSNSVLEHVPDPQAVLERCNELLAPGGRLVVTVPLRRMNEHLALRLPIYVRARQRQLQHCNLWTVEEWTARLERAGFDAVRFDLYLDARACRRWDRVDAAGALGTGRYRVAPILHRLAAIALPTRLKQRIKASLALQVLHWARQAADGPGCAAVLIATTPE